MNIEKEVEMGFFIAYHEESDMPLEQRVQRVKDTADKYMVDKEVVDRIHKDIRAKLHLPPLK